MALPTPQGVSSLTFKPPPLDGSLTFPELFDYNATHNPKHPLFRYNDPANGGFRTILWEEGVAAFHTAGHYFKKYIRGEGPVTVGILANISMSGSFQCPSSKPLYQIRLHTSRYWPVCCVSGSFLSLFQSVTQFLLLYIS